MPVMMHGLMMPEREYSCYLSHGPKGTVPSRIFRWRFWSPPLRSRRWPLTCPRANNPHIPDCLNKNPGWHCIARGRDTQNIQEEKQ